MSVTVELGAAAAMGLLGSVHCVGMCGGIASVLSAGPGASCGRAESVRGALATNAGRLTTYVALGALAGVVGGAFRASIPLAALGTGARIATALVLVGVGLHLAGVTRGIARLEALGRPVFSRVRGVLAGPTRPGPVAGALRGMAWGLLPCGLVYGALALAALSGSAWLGAATMLVFGLGTLPAMLAVGAFASSFVRLVHGQRLRAAAGILVAASGAAHLAIAVLQGGHLPSAPAAAGDERPCCASRPAE